MLSEEDHDALVYIFNGSYDYITITPDGVVYVINKQGKLEMMHYLPFHAVEDARKLLLSWGVGK